MSKILVFIQQENGKINSASFSAIKAAKELSALSGQGSLLGVCLGQGAKSAASNLKIEGFEKVIVCEDSRLSPYIGLTYANVISELAKSNSAEVIIGASTSSVKDFFPALAALIDFPMISEVLQFKDKDTFVRPMYAGNVLAEVCCSQAAKILSVRASSFSGLEMQAAAIITLDEVSLPADLSDFGEVLNFDSSASERPELGGAKIVVSGGRGVQSKEGFERLVYPLADALGAAIGASRAAVDAGFAPNDWQVGQTGKTVAPQLYIALGISGAIQHLAGMKDSKVVVAINKDAEAPIFDVADFGLVADIEKAVPELIQLIKQN
jgi:electron transfer flavoprotein alpha subunit